MMSISRLRAHLTRRQPGDDTGAAAVEFALVASLLFVILFGIINFGIVFSQQLTLNNAAREGARKAVITDPSSPNRTCDGIRRSVQNQIAGLGITATNVSVKVTQDGWSNANACGTAFVTAFTGGAATRVPCTGSFSTATGSRSLIVEARYTATLPAALPPIPRTITLGSKAVYRCEFSA